MIIMHQLPFKSQNYYMAKVSSNPLLILPFKSNTSKTQMLNQHFKGPRSDHTF